MSLQPGPTPRTDREILVGDKVVVFGLPGVVTWIENEQAQVEIEDEHGSLGAVVFAPVRLVFAA